MNRKAFIKAGSVGYKCSGQILELVDYMAFICWNLGMKHIFVTGHSGDGLISGVLAEKLITDKIEGIENPEANFYALARVGFLAQFMHNMLNHRAEINTQYELFLRSDINDIKNLVRWPSGVRNPKTKKPTSVCPRMRMARLRSLACCVRILKESDARIS